MQALLRFIRKSRHGHSVGRNRIFQKMRLRFLTPTRVQRCFLRGRRCDLIAQHGVRVPAKEGIALAHSHGKLIGGGKHLGTDRIPTVGDKADGIKIPCHKGQFDRLLRALIHGARANGIALSARKSLHLRRFRREVSYLFSVGIQSKRGQRPISHRFIPTKRELKRIPKKAYLVKQNVRLGINRILRQKMHDLPLTVKSVVNTDDGNLIKRIGRKPVKANVVFSNGKLFLGDQPIPVVEVGIDALLLAASDQLGTIQNIDGCFHGIEIGKQGKCRRRLILRCDDNVNGALTLHTDVLDLGSVYVLDGVDGILYHTLALSRVDLKNKVFKIRARFKHIV